MISIGGDRIDQRGYWRIFIAMPFIYAMVIPLVIMDVTTMLYQAICFPLYGVTMVKRSAYVRPGSRGKKMLNWISRFNCWYCGYGNGVVGYVREVIAQTERYWCPLRHSKMKGFIEPAHHAGFVADNHPKELHDQLQKKV